MKNIKIANINIKLKQLFKRWLEITNVFHKLTNQQEKVLALILYYHYKYQKDISNDKILWKIIFDYDTKALIKEELDIKDQVFQNILYQLRKKNIIIDNRVVKTYIPDLEQNSKTFKVTFNFSIIDE
tara:strand:+ start:6483 stop:6863 length:381 start_codon:yes stop_codon:yes gene_type:complete